jgi:hypothetical protein
VNYVHSNPLAKPWLRKLGFEPVVVTAATGRTQAEDALGMAARNIIPVIYESTGPDKDVSYAGVSTSG